MTFKCNYQVIYGVFYPFLWTKMFYTFHMLNNHKVWLFSNQRIWSAWRLTFDWFRAEYPVFVEINVAIEMIYFPLFHEMLLILTYQLQEIPLLWYQLKKSWILKILPKLCCFDDVQRADNLAKIISMRIILTSARWEHNVWQCYAPFTMIDNISRVFCLKHLKKKRTQKSLLLSGTHNIQQENNINCVN